jgi:hypothetical protein
LAQQRLDRSNRSGVAYDPDGEDAESVSAGSALSEYSRGSPQIDLFEMTGKQWDDGMAFKLHGARRLKLRT